MAWEISHTVQAWVNVRCNLETWSKVALIRAIRDESIERGVRPPKWSNLRRLPKDILVDSVVECVERHSLCSNGGFEFYIDPDGWHAVSCDPPKRGYCGSHKRPVNFLRETGGGKLVLSCGCEVIPEVWTDRG